MSKIDANGMEHGRRGDKIYVVLNGQQIKKDPYRPSNPRTPAQQMHRAKLAFANRLSAHLAEAVNLGFARVAEETKKHPATPSSKPTGTMVPCAGTKRPPCGSSVPSAFW